MSSAPSRRRTALFAKRPRPGEVKTRLCPPLTPAEAARLQDAMLRDVAERLADAPELGPLLAYAPPEAGAWFRAEFPRIEIQLPQSGPDLGQRLARFTTRLLEEEPGTSLVVVGSDQPLVGIERLAEAHAALEAGADLVLGPDPGGGYYAVGLREPHPELFTRVAMSTDGMAAATRALAEGAGLSVHLLEVELDVDVGADLRRLAAELRSRRSRGGPGPFPARTWNALVALGATP